MRASETAVGAAWLQNFAEVDQPAATMLLDSLRFASRDVMSAGLQTKLRELTGSGVITPPIMAVPERKLSEFTLKEGATSPRTGFDDFLPGGRVSVTPGSEGFVGRLLRDFAAAGSKTRNHWIAPDAELDDLRSEKCRSMIIATDYIGSGDQIRALAAAIGRNRTIRSWRSLGLIKIYGVAFAATPAALARLRRLREIDDVWSVEGAPTFDTAVGWTEDARDAIRKLCVTESRVHPRMALGYGGTAGLFASAYSVPNNLPAVFRQERSGWRPLFRGKTVPLEVIQQFGDLRPQPTLPALAERVGQLRLGRNERLDSMPPTSTSLLKLLVMLAKKPRGDEVVAAELGIDVDVAIGLRQSLEQLELVDTKGGVTPRGHQEINAQKRARRRTSSGLSDTDNKLYFPTSLR